MTYAVIFSAPAEADLYAIYDYIDGGGWVMVRNRAGARMTVAYAATREEAMADFKAAWEREAAPARERPG
jgi:plasmid stabilization system protein ParE